MGGPFDEVRPMVYNLIIQILLKIILFLRDKIMIRSGHNFAHVMTA